MLIHKRKSLLLIISLIFLSINLISVQGQQLDCSLVSLEQASAMPADIIAVHGASDELLNLSATATTASGIQMDILLVTNQQPFSVVDDEIIEQFEGITSVILISYGLNLLYAEPTTEGQVIGTIPANVSIYAQARNLTDDWVQVEVSTTIGKQTGWVPVSSFTIVGDVTNLPIDDPNSEASTEESLYLIVPFHPDDLLGGGELSILLSDSTSECDPLSLQITAMPESPGAFDQTINYFGEMLAVQRESAGITREELLTIEPADLPPHLVTLGVSQRLYDDPNNPESLLAIQEQIHNGVFTEDEIRFLDAMIGKTGLVDFLDTEIDTFTALQEARFGRDFTQHRGRQFANNTDDNIFAKPLADNAALPYPTINTVEDLAREMTEATSALYKLTEGASGKVLNDLGAVAAIGGAVAGSDYVGAGLGEFNQALLQLIFEIGGKAVYIVKSGLEKTAYSGPTVFKDFQVNIDPTPFENENGTQNGSWTVTVVVETTPWRINIANAYDATRSIPTGSTLDGTGVDKILTALDVASAVCGGNGSPCGDIPEVITIDPHSWTIRDIDAPEYFDVSRPDTAPAYADEPFTYAFLDSDEPSNVIKPINAGTYPILIVAPEEKFGSYKGNGFDGDAVVVVSEIDINYDEPVPMPDLILAEGETQELCYTARVDHALREDNVNDLSYKVKDSDEILIASGEVNRDEEFCFTVGPIDPPELVDCDLEPSYEHYTIELTSLAKNGSRGGEEWHDESLAEKRERSFFIRVDAEEPDKPDECQPGMWYLVLGNITMACPTLTTTIPINGEPIPVSASSLNSGTSVFGRLDQVFAMPGAEVIPPDAASEIVDADRTFDSLQTTNMELDSTGMLFTNIPEIAQAGASYIFTIPIDSSGATPGEVLFTMLFTSDKAFKGEMLMKLNVPNVGVCEVTTPLSGYFEDNTSS